MAALTASPAAALSAARLTASSSSAAPIASARALVPAPLLLPLSAKARSAPLVSRQQCCRAAAAENGGASKADKDEAEAEGEEEEVEQLGGAPVDVPSVEEIQFLLNELCEETQIAELKLKVGSFSLHVRRDVEGAQTAPAAAAAAAAAAPMMYAPPVPAFSMMDAMAAAPAAAAPEPAPAAAPEPPKDEGLQYITSPRVGVLRRGKLYKGKHGRAMVLEGAVVKKGQTVCFLEQLGTNLAIEAEIAGTVVEFLMEDGAPIGYADRIVAIRPSFPGIMKLT